MNIYEDEPLRLASLLENTRVTVLQSYSIAQELRRLHMVCREQDKMIDELTAKTEHQAKLIASLQGEGERLKKAVTVTAWAYGNLKEKQQ